MESGTLTTLPDGSLFEVVRWTLVETLQMFERWIARGEMSKIEIIGATRRACLMPWNEAAMDVFEDYLSAAVARVNSGALSMVEMMRLFDPENAPPPFEGTPLVVPPKYIEWVSSQSAEPLEFDEDGFAEIGRWAIYAFLSGPFPNRGEDVALWLTLLAGDEGESLYDTYGQISYCMLTALALFQRKIPPWFSEERDGPWIATVRASWEGKDAFEANEQAAFSAQGIDIETMTRHRADLVLEVSQRPSSRGMKFADIVQAAKDDPRWNEDRD